MGWEILQLAGGQTGEARAEPTFMPCPVIRPLLWPLAVPCALPCLVLPLAPLKRKHEEERKRRVRSVVGPFAGLAFVGAIDAHDAAFGCWGCRVRKEERTLNLSPSHSRPWLALRNTPCGQSGNEGSGCACTCLPRTLRNRTDPVRVGRNPTNSAQIWLKPLR